MKINKFLKKWCEAILPALIVVFFMYLFCWPVLIGGTSMEPNFFNGEDVFFSRVSVWTNAFGRGDIILCRMEYKDEINTVIKRIIGVPFDHISINQNMVYINGEKIDEDYLKENVTAGDIDLILGKDEYFVLGDNRNVSLDSRTTGPVIKSDIIGRIFMRFLPLNRLELIK